jgi:nickel-dependent lactate racemase
MTEAQSDMRLRFGREEIAVDFKGLLRVKVLAPHRAEPPDDLREVVRAALASPVDAPPLRDRARGARRIVITVPDRTRPRLAREILPTVIEELETGGVKRETIELLIANGTHGEHTESELADIVGPQVAGNFRIHQNLARNRQAFRDLGRTGRGTPVLLNRLVVEADLNVVIGTVATHYFAGWGGGRKMIVPGSCSIETAWANHRLTLTDRGDLNPLCRSGLLEGNPVHEDMQEAAGLLKNTFLVNMILDGWAQVAGLTAGDLVASHRAAIEEARGMLEVPVHGKCDLAILSAGGYPLDINMVQSHKSMDHVQEFLKAGGAMITLAECSNGAGSETFLPWFDIGDAAAVSKRLLEAYELNGHTALAIMKKLERFKLVFVSSLPDETVERMGMIPARSVEAALAKLGSVIGDNPLTYVFPCAWGILPEIRV